jgi:hypothetical protein
MKAKWTIARLLAAGCFLGTTFTMALPAMAQDTVVQEITGEDITASVASAVLDPLPYSNLQQVNTGSLTLSVDDARGTSAGWSVQILSSDFVYQGTSVSGADIPAANFSITSSSAPALVSGQPIDATGGPYAVDDGALNVAVTTIGANPGFGSGSYTQDLDVSLIVPAQSQTGLYQATLTVAISAAP